MPRFAGYLPGEGAVDVGKLISSLEPGKAVVPIIFYRAMLLAADTAPVDALCAALSERGLMPAALFVTSLKDRDAAEFLRGAFARLAPAVVVTTTAFAAGGNIGEPTPLDAAAFPCCRSSAPPRNARPGGTAPADSAPPISRCTSCSPNSTAAFSPAPSPSRTRCRRMRGSPSLH